MRKFTKILENQEFQKYFQIDANVILTVESTSEGEAGYIGDFILGSIKEQTEFTILNIKEISPSQYKSLHLENVQFVYKRPEENEESLAEQIILKTWDAEFGDQIPTSIKKLEFYHNMRNAGFSEDLIFKVLKDKIKNI